MVPGPPGHALRRHLGRAAAAVQQLLSTCHSLPQYPLLTLPRSPLLAGSSSISLESSRGCRPAAAALGLDCLHCLDLLGSCSCLGHRTLAGLCDMLHLSHLQSELELSLLLSRSPALSTF